jgi:hypothetical protein
MKDYRIVFFYENIWFAYSVRIEAHLDYDNTDILLFGWKNHIECLSVPGCPLPEGKYTDMFAVSRVEIVEVGRRVYA